MKKLLILTTALLTGGFTLPAAAQSHRGHHSVKNHIFVSGHLPCGSPIYSKRVRHGNYYSHKRLSTYELRRYLDHQRRLAAQRDLERRYARAKSQRSPHYRSCIQVRRR